MKVRNDFVSNSSSSSYIITTKESKRSLIDFIVKNAHSKRKDGSDYWSDSFDEENRDFLKLCLSDPYVQLVIGNFDVFGETQDSNWLEEAEDNANKHLNFSNLVVDREDISKFVKDGEVKLSFDDFKKGNCPKVYYFSYKVFEITQDSIDFTRWLLSKCDSRQNKNWIALDEFYKNEIPESVKRYEEEISKELYDKWKKLSEACNGLMLEPEYTKMVKVSKDNWKKENHLLSELLDKYQKAIDEGNKIYRICFGNSGEGTNWSSYVWTDHATFYNDKRFDFEYDCWW